MKTDNLSRVDAQVLEIAGRDKVKLLLAEHSGSVRKWALQNRLDSTDVYLVLNGQRSGPAYERIYRKIAATLEVTVAEAHHLIDGTAPKTEAA